MLSNPWLLWFIPLALVPIILHLITLQRLRTVELSTFRFLMDSYVQQRRKLKLLEFLLMVLRTLLVVLIVLMMARPVARKFGFLFGAQTGQDVTIVVDAGASMSLRSGGITSLERAQKTAKTIVGLLKSDDYVTVIRAGGKPEVVTRGFASDPEAIMTRIDAIESDTAAADLSQAMKEVFNSGKHGPRVVYLLSDARKKAWATLADQPILKRLGEEARTVVMNVGPTEPVVNLGVVGDPPREARAIAGLPVLLSATVVNSSADKPVESTLTVMLDDKQVTQINLSLEPGQKATRYVTVTPSRAGVIRGRFELPADAFPDDDAYLFCLNVEPNLNVLVVTPPEGPDPADRPGLYVRSALESPRKAMAGVSAVDQQLSAALVVTAIVESQLTPQSLETADVVVLADVAMDQARGDLLRKYLEQGGGVFVFPGARVKPDDYYKFLLGAGPGGGWPATLLAMGEPVGDPNDEGAYTPVTGLDLSHPVLSAFADRKNPFFGTVRLYRYFPLRIEKPEAKIVSAVDTLQPRRSAVSLMQLPNRTPALLEARVGEGKLLLAAFPATPDWSNLPLKPEFVPTLLRSVAYLRKPAPAEAQPSVRPHQPAAIRIARRWEAAQVQVTDPAGKPDTIELHPSESALVGALLDTQKKGYYQFTVLPRTPGAPERLELGFAVNVEIGEADFTMLSESQVKSMLAAANPVYMRGSPDDPTLFDQLTKATEVWRTLIWVMFIVFGVEFTLATLRPRKEEIQLATTGLRPIDVARETWVQRFAGAVNERLDFVQGVVTLRGLRQSWRQGNGEATKQQQKSTTEWK